MRQVHSIAALTLALLLGSRPALGQTLVKDIKPGMSVPLNPPSAKGAATVFGGELYFRLEPSAFDSGAGGPLWKSDGTLAGTGVVKPVLGPYLSGAAFPQVFVNVGGEFYFGAISSGSQDGRELWKSDGTAAGTRLVKDILPGEFGGGLPGGLLGALGGRVYFGGCDGVSSLNATELWASDGSAAGTELVLDINTTSASAGSNPSNGLLIGQQLFFTANDGIHGIELWVTDGSAAGTRMVKDINPTAGANSSPYGLCERGGLLVFGANDGASGAELWTSDGTEKGTQMLADINTSAPGAGSNPGSITVSGSNVYFSATDGVTGIELWVNDLAGTHQVSDINPGAAGSSPQNLLFSGGRLFFSADDGTAGRELWNLDAQGNTLMVADLTPGPTGSTLGWFTDVAGTLAFSFADADHGRELWRSDGTALGTQLVRDINPTPGAGSLPLAQFTITGPSTVGPLVFFSADDGVNNLAPWRSDLTEAGTFSLRTVPAPVPLSSYPTGFMSRNGKLLFTATDASDVASFWESDGTEAGTVALDVPNMPMGGVVALGDKLIYPSEFFTTPFDDTGLELFVSDGTAAGSMMLKDIYPGIDYYYMAGSSNPGPLVVSNGKVFFGAADYTPKTGTGRELYTTDGTPDGTQLVTDLEPGLVDGVTNGGGMVAFGTGVLYSGYTSATGNELFFSDGTAAGTALVKDINPDVGDSWPGNFLIVNGLLYFTADDGVHGEELWRSDGTADGTYMVKDIEPTPTWGSYPRYLTALGNRVVFVAYDSAVGRELFVSDGTDAGTLLLEDIYPGSSTSQPEGLCATGNSIFFSAADGAPATGTGRELYVTDGTPAGTHLLKDIATGPDGSLSVWDFGCSQVGTGRHVIFSATDLEHGFGYWLSDGTSAGTRRLADVHPGLTISPGSGFLVIGDTAYLSAYDTTVGMELFTMPITELGVPTASHSHHGGCSMSLAPDPTSLRETLSGMGWLLLLGALVYWLGRRPRPALR